MKNLPFGRLEVVGQLKSRPEKFVRVFIVLVPFNVNN